MSKEHTLLAPITGPRPIPETHFEEFGIGLSDIVSVTDEGDAIASIYNESLYFHRRGEVRVRAARLPLARMATWVHGFMPACDPRQLWVKVQTKDAYPHPEEVLEAFTRECSPPEG